MSPSSRVVNGMETNRSLSKNNSFSNSSKLIMSSRQSNSYISTSNVSNGINYSNQNNESSIKKTVECSKYFYVLDFKR